MFLTIINDCRDANAVGRQCTRTASLFGVAPSFVGVENDLEAAGNLIDALDAANGAPGVILANVAPRHGAAKRWPNGTPFGWFRVGETLVAASVDGLMLSLVKKLGLANEVRVWDIPTAAAAARTAGLIDAAAETLLGATQFRSMEFLPRAAHWAWNRVEIPTEPLAIASVADAPTGVWWIDNFGNCKTTVLATELGSAQRELPAAFASLPTYPRLKDVPNSETAFVAGSSGFGERRFAEIVVQGGSAAERFGLRTGAFAAALV